MLKSNPIFFKDLLISLNSKTWKNIIIFFTLIYFIIFLFVVADYKINTFSPNAGHTIFSIIWPMQLTILCFIWYIKWLLSISNEKDKNTLEFVMITKINSWKFIIWKFLANFFYIFLLILISLPFLGIWLILGWVNIQDILLYFLYSTSYISVAILMGMFFSSISKNNIFSIIYGASGIWIFFTIVLLTLYNLNYIGLQQSLSTDIFGYALFPVFIFDTIRDYTLLDIFGININFVLLHILIYGLIIIFLLRFLYSKFKQYTIISNKSYWYIWTAVLFILFLLMSKISENGEFLFIFFFLTTTFFIYLMSEKNFVKKQYKDNYIYYAIIMTISLGTISITNNFYPKLFLLYISIFIIFFTFYDLLSKIVKQWKGIVNLFFVISLTMVFYVIPAISTQFLEINIKNPSQLIKATVKQEKIIKDKRDNIDVYNPYYKKYNDYLSVNTLYYSIFYLILSLIFFWLWRFLENKKKTLEN